MDNMNNTLRTSISRCATTTASWFLSVVPLMYFPLVYLALASLAINGCALHFADNGSALPSSARTIYVAPFENITYVSGINDQFMRYMKDAISSRGRLTVVDDPAQADLLLSGKILYTGAAPASLSGVSEPLSYGNTILVAATLTDRRTKAVVWSTRGISASSQASVVAQAIVPTTPQFLKQNLRGPDILNMTDMQVSGNAGDCCKGPDDAADRLGAIRGHGLGNLICDICPQWYADAETARHWHHQGSRMARRGHLRRLA